MKLIHLFLPVSIAILAPSFGWCASFDCHKASTPDERAICGDIALNDMDVRMSTMLEIDKHFLGMGARGALQDAQRDWLAGRRRCGADRTCLTAAYRKRLGELQSVIERAYTLGPL